VQRQYAPTFDGVVTVTLSDRHAGHCLHGAFTDGGDGDFCMVMYGVLGMSRVRTRQRFSSQR
jgi:hypothetical protein